MNDEIFQVDRYRGFRITIDSEGNYFFGAAYLNGTCLVTAKSNTMLGCLKKCKSKIDGILHNEALSDE